MPRLGLSSDIFLSSGLSNDTSGSIIYNGAGPQYLPGIKPTPGVVRYWMREGTRLVDPISISFIHHQCHASLLFFVPGVPK